MEIKLKEFLTEQKNYLNDQLSQLEKEKKRNPQGLKPCQIHEQNLAFGKLSIVLKIQNFINQPKTI